MIAQAVIIDEQIKTAVKVEDISKDIDVSIWNQAQAVYDGSYTVTPSFSQQTLETNGKMLTDDITVEAIELPETTATASDVFPGKTFLLNGEVKEGTLQPLEFVQDLNGVDITLDDTSYPSWTASTTATSILATENLGTFVADMKNYTYFIKWKYLCDFAYNAGATLKAMPKRQCIESWQVIYRRFNTLTQLQSGTAPYNAVATQMSAPLLEYYNTSGTDTIYLSATYGVYGTVQAATFSSTSSDTPTVTYKSPVIYARCNSSYFATGRKTMVDAENTKIKIKAELYRIKMSSSLADTYAGVANIWKNGL